LYDRGKEDEAIACFRQAIALDPKAALAHSRLGIALAGKGRLDEAIAAHREAIRLNKDDAWAHNNLGVALKATGQLEEALTAYREAIRLNKDIAEAHCNLGRALVMKGQFKEAVEAFRRGHHLGSRRADWPCPSHLWLRQAEQLARLDDRLIAVLQGKDSPKDAAERLAFAHLCQTYRQRYASAARFYAAAFAEQAGLAANLEEGHRYNAACAAALAGAGHGKDASQLDDSERAEMRYRALCWLHDDLVVHGRQLARGPAVTGRSRQALRHWQTDADLAAVRDPAALGKLPESEQVAWRNLWAGVAALLARTTPGN
jgi:Tfp pilus assembly protein PilF